MPAHVFDLSLVILHLVLTTLELDFFGHYLFIFVELILTQSDRKLVVLALPRLFDELLEFFGKQLKLCFHLIVLSAHQIDMGLFFVSWV